MATLVKDGRPVTVATWYLFESSGEVLLTLDAERVRLGHLSRDPRVALDVLEEGDWYHHVSLQLRVLRIEDDRGHADIDRLSRHYGGRPYPDHEWPRVSVCCEVRLGVSGETTVNVSSTSPSRRSRRDCGEVLRDSSEHHRR